MNKHNMPWLHPALLVAAIVALVMIVGYFDRQALDMEQAQYCRMVAMNKQYSDIGWPDYAGSFDKECTPEGEVRRE